MVEPNISTQGIVLLSDTLERNGGAIQSSATQASAALTDAGLDHDGNHKVDWRRETPEPDPPAKPAGLTATATAGSLDVSVDWDDVAGADDYLVRWRLRGSGQDLNDGVRPTSSETQITVTGLGSWVVRVEACNDAGCGTASAVRFDVEQAPPGQPANLSLADVDGKYEAAASWDATDRATSYRLGWQPSDGSGLSAGALGCRGHQRHGNGFGLRPVAAVVQRDPSRYGLDAVVAALAVLMLRRVARDLEVGTDRWEQD